MGYYVRVFADRNIEISVEDLRQLLLKENLNSQISVEGGDDVNWSELSLRQLDNTEIALH
jgi:hypothetical protein